MIAENIVTRTFWHLIKKTMEETYQHGIKHGRKLLLLEQQSQGRFYKVTEFQTTISNRN